MAERKPTVAEQFSYVLATAKWQVAALKRCQNRRRLLDRMVILNKKNKASKKEERKSHFFFSFLAFYEKLPGPNAVIYGQNDWMSMLRQA